MSQRNGLFLFHRDFRIIDNIGLNVASSEVTHLYTCFIFTPEQVTGRNHYKSKNSIQFMIESLIQLSRELTESGGSLITMYGQSLDVLSKLVHTLKIDSIYFNRDYTPYAIKRDESIKKLCLSMGIECKMSDDYYLHVPGTIGNNNHKMYQKFTMFYEDALLRSVDIPNRKTIKNFAKSREQNIELNNAMIKFVGKTMNNELAVHGGRDLGLERLKNAVKNLNHYDDTRDIMSVETSRLSAYLKYGCISVREVFHAFKIRYSLHASFLRELIWRDFFAHLLFAYPDTLVRLHNQAFRNIKWKNNEKWLTAWKRGETGFPLVDAGMRELNHTGYMHNRARMLVATVLIKVLLLNWKDGEQYFAQQLVDYDVASNLGNWASVVGGGAYSMPWFRVMSPWEQSKKYDKDASYIKMWIPELREVPAKDIHKWYKHASNYSTISYPKPIVDYSEQKEEFLAMVKQAYNS